MAEHNPVRTSEDVKGPRDLESPPDVRRLQDVSGLQDLEESEDEGILYKVTIARENTTILTYFELTICSVLKPRLLTCLCGPSFPWNCC